MAMRERWRRVAIYLGLVDEPAASDPPPQSTRLRAMSAVLAGIFWALITWSWDGGSAVSIVLRGLFFAAVMFAIGSWFAGRAAAGRADRKPPAKS